MKESRYYLLTTMHAPFTYLFTYIHTYLLIKHHLLAIYVWNLIFNMNLNNCIITSEPSKFKNIFCLYLCTYKICPHDKCWLES